MRLRWDLKSYWKGLEAHPKAFCFKCLWLACLDKENYADCLDMQRLFATSISFIWISLWKVVWTQEIGSAVIGEEICHCCLLLISFWIQDMWKVSLKKIQGELFRDGLRESLCRYRWWRKRRWSSAEFIVKKKTRMATVYVLLTTWSLWTLRAYLQDDQTLCTCQV